jgi:succinate--hydroxymethylglutarate CoA-transferase
MEELGLGYETLREINPRLIYSSISGYGPTGPMAKSAGYDVIAAAQSGFMSTTGEPDRPPMKTGVAICDIITGLHATIGILASLYARDGGSSDSSPLGQKVENSLFESSLSLLFNVGSSFLNSGEDAQRWGTSHPSIGQ